MRIQISDVRNSQPGECKPQRKAADLEPGANDPQIGTGSSATVGEAVAAELGGDYSPDAIESEVKMLSEIVMRCHLLIASRQGDWSGPDETLATCGTDEMINLETAIDAWELRNETKSP